MSAPLIFMDTETTGLALNDDIWEFAAIRREVDGTETELHLFIEHDIDKAANLPESFFRDYSARYNKDQAFTREGAAWTIGRFLARQDPVAPRPHIVGAVPNFDTERIALLLRAHAIEPGWHHHLIDVENLAVGWLIGADAAPGAPSLPWDSNVLSRAVEVDPDIFERHTAMGDVRWAMAIYDRVMGATS